MDAATTAYMRRQPASSIRRERELQPEGTPAAAARRLVEIGGGKIDDQTAKRFGQVLHRFTSVAGGILIASQPARRHPVGSSIVAALASFLIFDEAASFLSGAAPSPHRYPWQTHLRGLIGHFLYGAVVGVLLHVGRRSIARA